MDLWELEERGYEGATIRFRYINPNWSIDQVNAWAKWSEMGLEGMERRKNAKILPADHVVIGGHYVGRGVLYSMQGVARHPAVLLKGGI